MKKKPRKRAPGGGRKPDDSAGAGLSLTIRVPPDVHLYLIGHASVSAEVTRLVRRSVSYRRAKEQS